MGMNTDEKWSIAALCEFFEMRVDELDKRMQLIQNAADRAVTKAEEAASKRLDSMNEFRASLSDQSKNLMSRVEADALFKMCETRISKVESYQSEQIGMIRETESNRQKAFWVIGIIVSILGAIGALIFKLP